MHTYTLPKNLTISNVRNSRNQICYDRCPPETHLCPHGKT